MVGLNRSISLMAFSGFLDRDDGSQGFYLRPDGFDDRPSGGIHQDRLGTAILQDRADLLLLFVILLDCAGTTALW